MTTDQLRENLLHLNLIQPQQPQQQPNLPKKQLINE